MNLFTKQTRKVAAKRFVLLFLTLLVFGFKANAQIPTFTEILKQYYNTDKLTLKSVSRSTPYGQQFGNYTFEEWETVNSSYLEPVSWNSFMTADGKSTLKKYLKDQITKSTEIRPGSTGSYSARIFSTSTNIIITKIIANANMTTGQIYAGSTTANNDGNYNFTKRSDENFNTPLTTIPDSLTVWVAFKPKDASKGNARITTTIHGDTDLKQQAKSGDSPADMVCATANQEIEATSTSAVVWKRVTIPFVAGPHNDPRYILTTFNTNKTPGGGSDGDELYVDDICLIYNPTLNMEMLAQTEFDGTNMNIEIPFTLGGSMSVYNLNKSDNVVIAQLSDASGSFANPVELGRVTTNVSGKISGVLPADLTEGTYKVRVVSTNYPMVSNERDITIKYPYVPVPEVEIALGEVATKSVAATFTPNADCAEYYFMIAPATQSIDAAKVKANGEKQTKIFKKTFENLISNTDYKIYALPVDVEGNNGEIKSLTVKTQAFVPQIEVVRNDFTAKSITATFTPNADCAEYYFMIVTDEVVDAGVIKTNGERQTEVFTKTFENLTSNTDYTIYALPVDVDGFNGEIKSVTITTKALVPQVEIIKGNVLTYSISASFTQNADCAKYYVLIAEATEIVDAAYVEENGEEQTAETTILWEELLPNTNYAIYALPIDVEGNEGTLNSLVVKTKVEAGVSEVELEIEKLSETSVTLTATPNENTVLYHYIVMTKAEADAMGEDAVMQKLNENENYLTSVDVNTMTVESNVAYYVIAQGKNADDKWGEVTSLEFVVAGPAEVAIAVEKLTETSVEVTATPNENAVSYKYIVIEKAEADAMETDILMQRLEEANELNGIDVWTWTVKSNVEYYVIAQAENADGRIGEMTKVEFIVAGPAAVAIVVEETSETSVEITTTPNEDAVAYHYIVITKAEADEMGEDALLEKLNENEEYLEGVNTTEVTIESNVAYYVVAQAKNADNKFGAITKVEFIVEVAGPAKVAIEVKETSKTTVLITATPNENTVAYHYIVIEKAEADSIGEDALLQRLEGDDNYLEGIDEWEWTVKSNVEYYVIAQAKNADDKWGEITKAEFIVINTESVSELNDVVFEIYPNPATEYVRISADSNIESLIIFSIDGNVVYSENLDKEETTIDVTAFAKGSYIIRMISNDKVFIRRIIVR